MMHGRGLLEQETSRPTSASQTLRRLVEHFSPFWPALLMALIFVVISTWAQVTNPELTGQLVDCYLSPAVASSGMTLPGASSDQAGTADTNCWLSAGKEPTGLTQTLIKNVFALGGLAEPKTDGTQTNDERLAGLLRMILLIIVLYVVGSVLTGLTFFSMTWAGQHVLRSLRTEVFEHLHRLPVGYYAEHEAGDLMSRITNDTETINQAISFALVNVASGILLLVWIAYNMLSKNIPFALLSMAVTPIMVLATVYFSDQARKAFRTSR